MVEIIIGADRPTHVDLQLLHQHILSGQLVHAAIPLIEHSILKGLFDQVPVWELGIALVWEYFPLIKRRGLDFLET